ncbi:MAG: S41 family peptidase [Bacteroidetes bacterium]|nr:S41 family peptidase [Bacteroidota bacterium]MBS1541140.1 S41 family peptidase [Bacteroidota bacterium]
MKKKIIISAVVILGLTLFAFSPPADRFFEIAKNLEIFSSLFKEVNALYVDDTNPNRMVRHGIDAMLSSLDPYTNYIPEDEIEDYRTLNTGQYGGIGASTINLGNRIVVNMVFENYPAYKNGLKIGDEIVRINDIDLSKISVDESNRLMKGQVGTSVKISVKRLNHPTLIDLEFKREKIRINSVPYFGMIPNSDVGFIQLTEFTNECSKELKKGIHSLKDQGAKKLILDLRGNPGGHLNEAVEICNFFIPKGKLVVATKGKSEQREYETQNNPLDETIPLIVLINRGSASASEIVAGTLQDYDRAVIMGEKSYGKGLVQMGKPFIYNSYIKITTAKYYTPSGRCIQVLDYSHRRPDGSVGAVPDSIKKEFKTSHGRSVFDGGGIEPDIVYDNTNSSELATALVRQGYIFDYATRYAAAHASIAPPKNFSLTASEYQAFVSWVNTQKLVYQTKVESDLNELRDIAGREQYLPIIQEQVNDIQKNITNIHKEDFTTYQDLIKSALEQEIVARYYLERGAAEYTISHNAEVSKAVEAINNTSLAKKILGTP